jgi:hypothetical protein
MKKTLVATLVVFLGIIVTPRSVFAAAKPTPWGGEEIFESSSICSSDCGSINEDYGLFFPLYIPYGPIAGGMTRDSSGKFGYPNYTLQESAWALGYYMPGPQCYLKVNLYYFYVCVPLDYGKIILQKTGTSLPLGSL